MDKETMKLLLPFALLAVLPFHFTYCQIDVCFEDTSNLTDSDLFILQLVELNVSQINFPEVNISTCEGTDADNDEEEEMNVSSNNDRGFCNPKEKIECMCGRELEESQRAYQRRLCSTCSNFGIIQDNMSLISFCRNSLSTPDYRGNRLQVNAYCVKYSKVNESTDLSQVQAFNKSTLSEVVETMEASLRDFSNVLKRTIVGVYLRSRGQRCACLDAYKKWLCSTTLPLYEKSKVRDKEGKTEAQRKDTNCTSTKVVTLDGEVVAQKRPCLDVCYGVLQICPYYLPSRFQEDIDNEDEFKTVISGGYPAFDCPRKSTVKKCNQSNSMCSYTLSECDCLKFSFASSVHTVPLHLLAVVLFVSMVALIL